jgi:hypothetical protein
MLRGELYTLYFGILAEGNEIQSIIVHQQDAPRLATKEKLDAKKSLSRFRDPY